MRSAGVQSRMSHSAMSTFIDSRSGLSVTRRYACEADNSTPRADDPAVLRRISEQLSSSVNVRAKAGRPQGRRIGAGGRAMTIHGYVSKAVQDDVQLAGPRSRLILEAWQARMARRDGVVPAAPVRRVVRVLPAERPSGTPRHFVICGAGPLVLGVRRVSSRLN
jgi:hypothetical protein